MLALFGVLRGVEGTIRLDGQPYTATSPAARQVAGLRHRAGARGPQDRGAAAADGDRATISASPPWAARASWAIVDAGAEDRAVEEMIRRLHIKLGDAGDPSARCRAATSRRW